MLAAAVASTFLLLAQPELYVERKLPALPTPDWASCQSEASSKVRDAWRTLASYRPDREYADNAAIDEAKAVLSDALETLEADREAACAAGTDFMREADDDWTRLMVADYLDYLMGAERADPFRAWALAQVTNADVAFERIYESTKRLAEKRDPNLLPAVFAILRTRDERLFLEDHFWFIETHECMYYVLSRYGEDVLPYLRPLLRHEDPYVRRNAAFALGLFFDDASEDALVGLLRRGDPSSGGAAFALGLLDAKKHAGAVAELLTHDDPRTRFLAAWSLYELDVPATLESIEKAIAVETDGATLREMEETRRLLLEPSTEESVDEEPTLSAEDVSKLLGMIEEGNGLSRRPEVTEAITVSAERKHLEMLETIRRKTTYVPSDMGNKAFREWCDVIKAVRRRLDGS